MLNEDRQDILADAQDVLGPHGVLDAPPWTSATIDPTAVAIASPISAAAVGTIRSVQRITRIAVRARPCTNMMPVAAGWAAPQ